jgi:hypothetical protein
LPFTGLDPRKLDVEILYRLVGLPEPPERDLHPTEMLFTLGSSHRQATRWTLVADRPRRRILKQSSWCARWKVSLPKIGERYSPKIAFNRCMFWSMLKVS